MRTHLERWVKIVFGLLVLSAAYVYAFPSPTVTYVGFVLLHSALGVAGLILAIVFLKRARRDLPAFTSIGWLLFLVAGALGVVLLWIGTARPQWNWLYAHIVASLIATAVLIGGWIGKRATGRAMAAAALAAALIAVLGYGAWYQREVRWVDGRVIRNPRNAPASMAGEGDGPNGPFFPSSAQTVDGKLMPGQFFMESESCKRCHEQIYNQWNGSAHHFSSFNNQWYRKSIEYMQDVVGTKPSKWCGGCHDPAVLYSGMMDTPIKQIVNRPESQAGLGCVMCHSIAKVKSTMGQADFVLEYPRLHDLAATKNPIVRVLHDYAIRLNPEAHRRVFLKPFMKTQTAEFCSSCHKVHLDVPVNHYRWTRGFNEYDNWQASGVSGQGARSFYYPPKSQQCADCHMPLTKANDDGNIDGFVHSHAFPGANTALPTANQDAAQLKLQEDFLKEAVSVDIFGVAPAQKVKAASATQTDLSTMFAVGEEAESPAPAASGVEAAPVTAPLNRVHAKVRAGDDVRVEVVVRTRKVGHFFPGGTIDAYDTWLELKATDENDRVVFWSGKVEDDGRGPVEPGAHFYRSLLVDGNGNPINKRNAWSARSVVYVHLIPPGAADTVHFRLHVPENAHQIKLHARMCYRKFSWWNTQFSFAGVPDPAQKNPQTTTEADDRRFVFTGDTSTVSGKLKRIPDLPVVPLAEAQAVVEVLPRGAKAPAPEVALNKDDWTRWNDYGIGLLLQGDLKGARAAFEKITEMDASNPDGWVNLGRVAVQEGDMDRARSVLERALKISPKLARANFFYAKVLRNDGEYAQAEQSLRTVLAQYPRDRVALNDLGRILFLERRYQDGVQQLTQVLQVDPEDLQAHYNLMLCYQGLGREDLADSEKKLYLRFKADEAAQSITGPYRQLHAEDNNERQPIHEHVSVALATPPSKQPRAARQANARVARRGSNTD